MRKTLSVAPVMILFILGMAADSVAADYPTRPITLINPQSPGGAIDMQSRSFASVAEKYLGQPVVVVNKPGASGMIGGLAGAQAAPDGYTLTVCSGSLTTVIEWEIANGRKSPFTLQQDFLPLGSFTLGPLLFVVPYDSSWKSLGDLINDARAKPGFYAYCSGGLYSSSHLPIELFARAAGLKFRHVPQKGGGPCLSAVLGKHVDFGTQYPGPSLSLIQSNKLRALANTGAKRLKAIPEVPGIKELGIDAEYYGWVGILAPKKTPAPIAERLREVVEKVAGDKSFVSAIEKTGDEVHFMNSNELAKYWEYESEKIGKLLAELVKEASKK